MLIIIDMAVRTKTVPQMMRWVKIKSSTTQIDDRSKEQNAVTDRITQFGYSCW